MIRRQYKLTYETKLKVSSKLTCDPNGRNPFVKLPILDDNDDDDDDDDNNDNNNNNNNNDDDDVVKIRIFLVKAVRRSSGSYKMHSVGVSSPLCTLELSRLTCVEKTVKNTTKTQL